MTNRQYGQRLGKYGNKKCRCVSGHMHDSRGEASYCDVLRLLKLAGEIQDYKLQVKYNLTVEGIHFSTHIVDFLVTEKDGTVAVHEFKGMPTREWRLKKKVFEANYPHIPYRVKNKLDI